MVSMKDIAKQCQVSVASVSKALNGYPDIGEDTRQMIIRTANEMGYFPNSSARALKTKRSYNLGVLFVEQSISGLTHDYFNHVLESFRATAEKKGYDITFITGNVSGQKMSYYEHCKFRGVDGVLVACIKYYEDDIQDLIRSDLPMVTIDHVFEGKLAVVSNNVQGMEDLVAFLYKKGHRKIAYIHGEDTPVTRNRLSAFHSTTYSFGLNIPESYVREGKYRNSDKATNLTRELLELPDPPTCIIYPDDFSAVGGIREIRQHGLRIPEDISIAGYDGLDIVRVMDSKLATMCQDTEKIGRMAAEKLVDLIEHPKTTLIDKFTVDGVLFAGASVRQLD